MQRSSLSGHCRSRDHARPLFLLEHAEHGEPPLLPRVHAGSRLHQGHQGKIFTLDIVHSGKWHFLLEGVGPLTNRPR